MMSSTCSYAVTVSAPSHLTRRHAVAGVLGGLGGLGAAALGGCDRQPRARATATASGRASAGPPSTQRPTLPSGLREVFPAHRLVGFAGIAGHGPALGRVGVGDLDDRMDELVELGAAYAAASPATSRPPASSASSLSSPTSSTRAPEARRDGPGRAPSPAVLPTLELIATVVQPRGAPGPDGMFRTRASDETVGRHLEAARRVEGILLLAIQPGRSDFVTEVTFYERWLREPDVGVALDPEWRLHEGQFAPEVFGHVTGKELDETAAYLAGLVAEHDLPEKVMLYHQLRVDIVRKPQQLRPHPGIAQVVSVDGIGSPPMKEETWEAVLAVTPRHVRPGFKLFYVEDAEFGPIMTPAEVLGLSPRPDYVMYE